jgi:hypothetical protein
VTVSTEINKMLTAKSVVDIHHGAGAIVKDVTRVIRVVTKATRVLRTIRMIRIIGCMCIGDCVGLRG